MHDLRKQVLLESGKTLSRKQRSKQGTPSGSKSGSPAPSRSGSRVPSRSASDDESELSEGSQWGTNSIDELLANDADPHVTVDGLVADLYERMEQICDRKRSSAEGRELSLNAFTIDLMRHYAKAEIQHKMDELVPAVLKSVKAGQTVRETSLALKALALMVVTVASEAVYQMVEDPIKATITDGEHSTAKVAAIHALGAVSFYGEASSEEIEEVMDLLLEIISSDAGSIEEQDNAEVVTAALQEWGFLASKLDDLEAITEVAMEAFVDQLESSDADVQIAAGENIALLFEQSYTEAESDDDLPEVADEDDYNNGPAMIKRYDVYRQSHLLERQLEDLARSSSKRLSKKDRKALHQAFDDILLTVEKPTRGPRYSTALDEDGREYGSRLSVAVPGGGRLIINTWWKLHRLNALKRLLQGGFLVHYESNEIVSDSLMVDLEH